MSQFLESEVQARLATLTPSNKPLDRASVIDGNEIILSMKDVVQRSLHASIDAFYYLVSLFVTKQLTLLAELQANLAFIERMSLAANTPGMQASSSKLAEIIALTEKLRTATGNNRARLLATMSTRVREFVQSSRMPSGALKVGVTPDQALTSAHAVSARTVALFQLISDGVGQFLEASQEFKNAKLTDAAFQCQAFIANQVMQEHREERETNLSFAVLDAILLEQLLNQRQSVIDLGHAKYTGPVVADLLSGAVLVGTTLPLTLTAPQVAALEVDGNLPANLTAPVSAAPLLLLAMPDSRLIREEVGVHPLVADGANQFFDFDGVGINPQLKPDVVQGSVRINFTVGAAAKEVRDDLSTGNLQEWDGFGLVGPVLGFVNYDTGVLNFATVTIGPPDVDTRVQLRYQLALIGKDAPYNVFKVFQDNTLLTAPVDLSTAAISTGGALAGALDGLLGGLPGTMTVSFTTRLEFLSNYVGSGRRLSFPDYTNVAQFNTTFGGAKWLVPPANLNQVLLAFNSAVPDVQGTDTGLADLIPAPAIEPLIRLETAAELILTGSVEIFDGTADKPNIAGVAVDDVMTLQSPIVSTHRVTSIEPTVVAPEILMPFGAGEGLAVSAVYSFTVRRDRLKVLSLATDGATALVVQTPGLGLSGENRGVVSSLTLAELPPIEYTIRKSDIVLQGTTKVGDVVSVNGAEIAVAFDATALTLPITAATIRAQGQFLYGNASLGLAPLQAGFEQLVSRNPVDRFLRFAASGTGHQIFAEELSAAKQQVIALQAQYLGYKAGAVRTVSRALTYLREEKMTLALAFLLNLRLTEFDNLTAEVVSSQTSLEDLLDEMAVTFGASQELVELFVGDTLLSDYTERSRDLGR